MAKVELLVAPGRESLADEWVARLARYLCGEERHRVLCIVPTGAAAAHLEKRLLVEFNVPGLFGGPIRTFYHLARDIARTTRLGGHDLSDLQRSLLLQDIAATSSVPTLSRVQRFPGFAAALGDLIGELKLAMIHPEELRRAMDKLPQSEGDLAARLRDVLSLYQRYQGTLERADLHDAEGLMWHAVSELARSETIMPADIFFFHGFRSFNQVQLRLLKVIADRAREVFIKLHHDDTRPQAFAASERALQSLRQRLGCEPQVEAAADDRGDIAHISANVFRTQAPAKRGGDSVIILESGSPAQEADQVAREIHQLVCGGGLCAGAEGDSRHRIGYCDVAVIIRGDEARRKFAHLLTRRGVPVAGCREALAASAVGRAALLCLEIIRERWPLSAVGALLKSPCLPGDMVQKARAEVNAWQEGVSEGRDIWFAPWRDDDTLEVRQEALAPVKELQDALREARSLKDMAEAARRLVNGLARPDASDPAALRDDDLARRKLEQVIGEVESVAALAGQPPSPRDFCEDLTRAIAAASYRPGARDTEGVAILEAQALGGETYPVVFVVNLLEGIFPAQAREDPFLRDRERRLVGALDTDIKLDLASERQAEERLLLWRAVSAATLRLYLSYPTADEKAREVLPSFYVDEVKRLFDPPLKVRQRSFSDLAPHPKHAISLDDWAACIFHGFTRDLAPRDQAEHAAHYNAWLALAGARPQLYVSPIAPYDPALKDRAVLAALGERDRPYHPSELECYLKCAYMYYCEKLLALHPLRREIAPVDYGVLVHEVLARLYREWRRESDGPVEVRSRDAAAVVARGLELLDECLARQLRFANLPGAQRDIERERLRVVLARFISDDLKQTAGRGLRPAFFELEFGPQAHPSADRRSRAQALDLGDVDGRRVLIAGRMDRVDLTREGAAVVVDYKSGKTEYDLRKLDEGAMLQAPLYARAVREVFGIEVAGVEYVSVASNKRSGLYRAGALEVADAARNMVVPPPELDAKLELAAEQARACVRRIRRGEIPRGPRDECPQGCAYRCICRVDAWTLRRVIQARERADTEINEAETGDAADAA
jgi:ATP-dependent helicase/DNAse subunit B